MDAHRRRASQRLVERHHAAIADPGEVDRAEPELLDQGGEVVAELLERHRPCGLAVRPCPRWSTSTTSELLGERRCQACPSVQRIGGHAHPAVEQHQRRSVWRALLVVVHPHRPDVDVVPRRQSCPPPGGVSARPSGSGRSDSRRNAPSRSCRRAPRRAWRAGGGRGRRPCGPRRSTRSPTPG